MNRRIIEEKLFYALMLFSLIIVLGSLLLIVTLVVINGAPSITLEMLTQTSGGEFHIGGGGGILNAIVGSILLAFPATAIAFLIGICIGLFLQHEFTHHWSAAFVRLSLDILWGIPSIVYGVFCFMIMIYLGVGSSLLAGIVALTLLEIPIITRSIDESIKLVPFGLKESAYSLGSTKIETALHVVRRQAFPGILAGVLLGLGRGIGDAASIIFVIGDSNSIPTSLTSATAALPTMIFNLYSSPIPIVRQRAYAAAFILLILVLLISIVSRVLTKRFTKHIIH